MAGPLLEGVQTGLGISKFIEQRRQFDTTSQLDQQKLALNEKKTQIDEQKRQSAELQAQFKRDTDTVKFFFNSGLKEDKAIPLALAAFNRLVKATGGPLEGPPLKASDFAPGAMKQVVAIMKSLDTYKGDPEDGLAMAATAIAPLVGRNPGEDKAIERAIKNIESQQEALKEGDEIFGTDAYKNATQYAKEEVGIFLRGGGDPGEAMRYLGENADASGSGWIGNDKNISTNDLAFAIESLQAEANNGTITEEGRERLSILLKTQDRVANISGEKTEASTKAKVRSSTLPVAIQKGMANLSTLKRITARIKKNFNADFVGKADFLLGAAREFTGKISKEEVTFRKDVAELGEIVLRMRSGAQINESEFERITKVLSRLSDQENVFKDSLDRTIEEISAIIDSKVHLATTPKGELSSSSRPEIGASEPSSGGGMSLDEFRKRNPLGAK